MSLGTITLSGSRVFNETTDNVYRLSTLGFGAPDNSIVTRPNTNPKAKPARASASSVVQKDTTADGKTVRDTSTATISFVIGNNFTADDARVLVTNLYEHLTAAVISQLLLGRG